VETLTLLHLLTLKASPTLACQIRKNDTSLIMNTFKDIPPLWDAGADLYAAVQPQDAAVSVDWRDSTDYAYNPGIPSAICLMSRALNILRSVPDESYSPA
jgi:hypothetical protein